MLLNAQTTAISLKAKLFRGFSDSSRLSILECLLDGPRNVSEIVELTDLSQPNASNHLACLRDCGLLTAVQEGRYVYYSLSDERVANLLSLADEVLSEVARSVYECTRVT